MLGFFGMFGRSREVRLLDEAVSEKGLSSWRVPGAMKITTVRLLKEAAGGRAPDERAIRDAAALLAYCMLGRTHFAEANGVAETERVEARMEAALEAGDSLDACLVLLTIHAKEIQPGIVERYDLEASR